MIKSLNNFFNKNNDNLPKIIAITTLITDIASLFYINSFWLSSKLEALVYKSMVMQGVLNPSKADLEQMTAVLGNSIGTMFFFFLIIHAIVYTLVFLKKKWAVNYVGRYVLMTILLTFFEFILVFNESKIQFLSLFLMTISYVFTFLGLKHFKKSQVQ